MFLANRISAGLIAKAQCRSFSQAIPKVAVTDDHIAELASKPLHPITLADLCKYGRPPLDSNALYKSANFTLSILPTRIAHRIQSLRNLPYIVVTNPHISKIHNNYVHSLSTLLPWAEREIRTLDDEIKFTQAMADLVQTHNNTISVLARGFLETRKYISPIEITKFIDEHLRARIGTRLVAEQHIALHFSSKPHQDLSGNHNPEPENPGSMDEGHQSSYIGVIDTDLSPAHIIRNCEAIVGDLCEFRYGCRPTVEIDGEPNYTFAHIPMHLEYILTELLKNSFRATIEQGMEREPIQITIAPLPEEPELANKERGKVSNLAQGNTDEASKFLKDGHDAELSSASQNVRPLKHSTPGVTIRIRDRGGGISPENYKHIWDYSFTTFNEDQASSKLDSGSGGMDALTSISHAGAAGGSSIAGLGYGLPLGRAYAEYFGGGIALQSLYGWGCDVYLSLRGVGKVNGRHTV